jgi:hypothetical protein
MVFQKLSIFLKNRPIIRSNRSIIRSIRPNFGFQKFSCFSRGSTSFRPNFFGFHQIFENATDSLPSDFSLPAEFSNIGLVCWGIALSQHENLVVIVSVGL